MKKFICIFLALLLVFGCLFALTGCDNTKDEEKDNKKEDKKPAVPTGYQEYKNEDISFAYPEGWEKQDGSVAILNDASTGNNITVAYEDKTDMYDNMTVDEFNSTVKPVMEAMGMSISNVTIKKEKTNNLDVIKIAFTTAAAGMSMKQTQYVTSVGKYTYTVTVTEVKSDAALVSNVFETLYGLK